MIAAVVLVAALCAVGAVALPRVGDGGSFEVERADGATSTGKASSGKDAGEKNDAGDSGDSGDSSAGRSAATSTSRATTVRSVVVVHVDGAVRAPGVYELHSTTPRVDDAVRAAGGLAEDADTTSINLASIVSDGQKIHVPAEGEEVTAQEQDAGTAGAVATGGATGTTGATGTQAQDAGKVNINTADETQLQQLPGVGEATAKAIVEDRQNNGAFSTPEDLMRVSGIGEKKFERMRSMVCV